MRALDEIRGRLNAAIPGPWEEFWQGHIRSIPTAMGVCQTFGPEDRKHPTAEFIAHTPVDIARLLNATQGVLDLHRPSRRNRTSYNSDGTLIAYTVVNDGPCVTCYPPHITQHCEECEDYDDTCAGVEGNVSHPWPCPTVAAITSALEAKS